MEGKKKFRPNSDLKLMDQVREVLRYYHYAYRTEQTYCDWIKRYLKFHGMKRHPQEMGAAEVEQYLSNLATKGKVAASTQRQALNAIVFFYREVPSCSDEIGFLFQESSLPSFQHSKP